MDCPHCGIENLIGATVCAACGKGMLSRPKFGPAGDAPEAIAPGTEARAFQAGPSRAATIRGAGEEFGAPTPLWGAGPAVSPPPPEEPQGPVAVMCRICRTPFDRAADAPNETVCTSCRNLAADVSKMEPGEPQIHPATMEAGPTEGLAARMGGADLRPKPIRVKKVGLRTGPVVAVAGLFLGLITLGVVAIGTREPDRAKELLGDVRPGEASITLTPDEQFIARISSTIRLTVVREEARAFNGGASKGLDFRQTSVQECEAALARTEDRGLVFDLRTQARVADQQGSVGAEDARDATIFPWGGVRAPVRVLAAASGELTQVDGTPVTPCVDAPPLFHLGALSPPGGEFRVGDKWKTDLTLPLLVDRQGRLLAWGFPAELTYAGRTVKNGYACAAFRIDGSAPRSYPATVEDDFNRREAKFCGAVWIELTTGIVCGADIESDVNLRKEAGKVESDLRATARVTIERR